MTFTGDSTFDEGMAWMKDRIHTGGAKCPLCGLWNQTYDRTLNERIVRVLFKMWHKAGMGWVHVPSLIGPTDKDKPRTSGEHGDAQHWGLIEKMHGPGSRGMWRLTQKGVDFLFHGLKISRKALVFKGVGVLDYSGPDIGVEDVIEHPWDLEQLRTDSAQAYRHWSPPTS